MPHLTLLEKGSSKTHRVDLDSMVGRDPACAIFVEGDAAKTVSGRHARFFLEDGKWFVEDAGSRNGTYIGTKKLEPGTRHPLAVGDVVGLGLTGTQLAVQETVGRAFAATMLESAPVPPPTASGIPSARGDRAATPGAASAKEVRVVLRCTQPETRWSGHSDRVTIGRALECIIRVEGESATSVSRVHAEIIAANDQFVLRDTGSRHGTYLNGKRLEGPSPIRAGDTIMLGAGGPTFEIEELGLGDPLDRSAAGAPTHGGMRATTPAGAARSLPSRDSQEFFQAQLPTPALDRPAFKAAEQNAVAQARQAKSSASMTRPVKSPSRNRAVVIVASVATAAAAIAAFFVVAQMSGKRAQQSANVRIAQQAAALEVARTEAAAARVTLDSATAANAPIEVLDSLRGVLDAASRKAARLDDSVRRSH